MCPEKTDWDLDTGLADDFVGTIIDAKFMPNPSEEYGIKDVGLNLIINAPEIDEEKPVEQWYSIGAKKGWQATKGGEEAASPEFPDSHVFNRSSRGGSLVAAMLKVIGGGNTDVGKEFMAKRGYQTQSKSYKGLTFHWKRVEMSTVGGGKSNVLLPDEFKGGDKPAAGAKAAAAKAAKATAEAPAATGDDSEAEAKLIELVKPGMDDKSVKSAAFRALGKQHKEYTNRILNGTVLADLVEAGKLAKDSDDKYL